ncbi:MAG: hypothetical protein P8186_09690 [Anaerolineae bacterium]|jgi:hypothetical protein
MSVLLRLPHGLMRRYLSWLERLLVAAGLSALLYGLMSSLPVYPLNWDLVILAVVFVVTLWSPGIAYFIAVAAAAYPLYTLSLYVAVLFLVVTLLGQRIFIHNLGATVLVLATPWLARYQVAWVVPLLGGIWWGAAGGAWMGGGAALWGQVAAGMAGLNPDWLTLIGSSPTMAGVAQRFGEANSLETLKLILEPLAPNATLLLYHLLQVVAWAVVGGIVGTLADRAWIQQRRPWGTIVTAALGAFALLGVHVGLGLWLEQQTLTTLAALWSPLIATTVVVAIVVGILEGSRDFLEHPLPPVRRRTRPERRHGRAREPERAPLPVPPQLPDWEPADEAEDLIMLELD